MLKEISNYVVGGALATATLFAMWYSDISDKIKGPEPGSLEWLTAQEEQYKTLRSDILDLKFQLSQTVDWQTQTNVKFTLSSVRSACVETASTYNRFSKNKKLSIEDCHR